MKVRITKVPDKALNARKWHHGDGGFLDNINKYDRNTVLETIERIKANSFKDGGKKRRTDEGGYNTLLLPTDARENVLRAYDPTVGFDGMGVLVNTFGKNQSHGEENEYYRAYLGLDNNIPKMDESAKTEWDDQIEKEKLEQGKLPSDFYGTTPRMNQMIAVMADTLNTGNLLRNYDQYKAQDSLLAPRDVIQRIYEQGKSVMDNPGTWTQVGELDRRDKQLYLIDDVDPDTNEQMPLGMLAKFGMKWDKDNGRILVHDTYDFPWYTWPFIPRRPKEMKIRGAVDFDPAVGSELLQGGVFHKERMAKPVANRNSH